MEGGLPLLRFLAPQIPSLANTALWHTLGQTDTSAQWDLRTAMTVQVLRQMMLGDGRPRSVEKVQRTTLKDPGVKGKMWVARDTFTAPEEGEGEERGLRGSVFKAVEDMKPEDAQLEYTKPPLAYVEVEWTGFRPSAGKEEAMPEISETEKFKRLMDEPTRKSETTILYFHGGAYYLCDPSTHRLQCSRLAKECGGRVCSVRYRLAPQTAFPGQLLDALQAYLNLLYPSEGALHEAVRAEEIVLAGDSAGGNLVFALLQLLLQFHRTSPKPTIVFRGREVDVPLPAGATGNSAWLDISRSLPSNTHNAKFDYLPVPSHDKDLTSQFKDDAAWPTAPPRGDFFCDLSLLDHPLVSPVIAEDWKRCPPIWLSAGWEMLRDEGASLAQRIVEQGGKVWWDEFEGMPHCFQMLLPSLPTSGVCYESWGEFCRRAVEESGGVQSRGRLIKAKSGEVEEVDVKGLGAVGLEEVKKAVVEAKGKRIRAFEEAVRGGKGVKAAL